MKKHIKRYVRNSQARKFWKRLISVFSCIVVFCTTYALVLPAITLEKTPVCGIEAHQHTDSCYEERLVCGLEEEEAHHHTDQCYTVNKELVCTIEEHSHNENCYDEEGNLTCAIEEHTHDDGCYREDRALTCPLEETDGHTHTQDCYGKVLTCTLQAHTHCADCYKNATVSEDSSGSSDSASSAPASDADTASDSANGAGTSLKETANESGNDTASDSGISAGTSLKETANESGNDTPSDTGISAGTSLKETEDESGNDTASDTGISAGTSLKETEPESADGTASDFDTSSEDLWDENQEAAPIPDAEEIDLAEVLTEKTSAWYLEPDAGEYEWKKITDETILGPEDLVRLYFEYIIPAGALDDNNAVTAIPVPEAILLTDEQIEEINAGRDGHGAQVVEGTRTPDEEPDGDEYVSAYFRIEESASDETAIPARDVVVTFDAYTIEKNRKSYDENGKMTDEGEAVTGFFTIDVTPGQIDFEEISSDTYTDTIETDEGTIDRTMEEILSEAEIILVQENEDRDVEEIGTTVRLSEERTVSEELRPAETDQTDEQGEDTAGEASSDDADAQNADESSGEAASKDGQIPDESSDEKVEDTQNQDADTAFDETAEDAQGQDTSSGEAVEDAQGQDADTSSDEAVEDAHDQDTDTSVDEAEEGANADTSSDEAEEGANADTSSSEAEKEDANADTSSKEDENDKEASEKDQEAVDEKKTHETAEKDADEKMVKDASDEADEAVDEKGTSASEDTDQDYFAGALTFEGPDYTVAASFDKDAGIPRGSVLSVKEITQDDDSYQEYRDQAEKAVTEQTAGEKDDKGTATAEKAAWVRLFDISIMNDGKVIEPTGPVSVQITYHEAMERAKNADVKAVHFEGEKETPRVLGTEAEGTETSVEQVSFDTDSFSVFAIVGTTIEKTVLASDGNNYKISVTYGEDAGIPEGAELEVREISGSSYESLAARTADALELESGTLGYVKFFDISIVKDGLKLQPAVPVNVQICVEDVAVLENPKIVHFGDGLELVEAKADGQTVSFEASGFSIYAVVDDTVRLAYKFYNGSSLVAAEYVKEGENLYDPGVEPEYGQTFLGWAYEAGETDSTKIYSIAQLNEQVAARFAAGGIEDYEESGEETNLYAVFAEAYYLRYLTQDEEGNTTSLKTVRVKTDAEDKQVTIDYTPTLEEGQVFQGWIDASTGTVYHENDTITLDHHVDLYLKLNDRHWLVFDANAGGSGSGASYTPPQMLIGDDAVTEQPSDPTRKGYTFTGWNTAADGSGTWWYKTDSSVNLFGSGLSEDTTLYAQWEAAQTKYYVIFWQQSASDGADLDDADKTYYYKESVERTADTDSTVTTTNADRSKGGTVNSDYGYYFTYNSANSDTTAAVNADGTTILNVYYDRRVITYTFSGNQYSYVENEDGMYGLVDGEYVELTESDGNLTYETGEYTEEYTATTSNNGTQYGLIDGEYVELTKSWGNWYYLDGNRYRRYTGTRYTLTQTPVTAVYEGTRYTRNTISSSTYKGLYGAAFNDWPELPDGYSWSANGYTMPLPLTEFNPAAAGGNSTATSVNFTRTSYDQGAVLTVYKMTTDGTWEYTDDWVITTAGLGSSGTWYPSETYTGFEIDAYCLSGTITDNSTWTSVTSSGSIRYNGDFAIRYARNQHNINYVSQGSNVTEREETVVEGVYYEASLSQYGEGGSSYYEPTNGKEGYYFDGWYEDEACLIPFDFNTTMPDHDVTVYAKWKTNRVRVVLVPTPDNAHNDEVQLANNQALTFRLDYAETISDANINSSVAKRQGYKLMGWYTSPTFEEDTLWNFSTPVTKEISAVDMNYQSSEDWTNNTYGDNDGKHNNVRGILKLYAKWELDVDENSIYIEYDVDDEYRTYDSLGNLQTTIPVDDTAYLTPTEGHEVIASIAAAPTDYATGFTFSGWRLMNADGSASESKLNAGDEWSIDPSYIQEKTLTDDAGNTATIKVIRFHAEFDVDEENKATMVTFDGNGGVTNDDAQDDSVTQAIQVNKTFTIPASGDFVREGYTQVGWAFDSGMTAEEYTTAVTGNTNDGEIDYDALAHLGIFEMGQTVAADNLTLTEDNNWDPLANKIYAIWKPNTYTITVKKIVDGETATDQNFLFSASVEGDDYTLSSDDAAFVLVNGGEKTIEGVPYGTVLTFTESPASGYSIQDVEAKQTTKPDGTSLSEENYIDLSGADGKAYTIKGNTTITYTNKKTAGQKLRIKKIGDDAEDGLADAVFSLKAASETTIAGFDDMSNILSMGGTKPGNLGYLPGNDADDATLFTLPAGTYTLTENGVPENYNGLSGAVTLTVTTDGITVTPEDGDESLVDLSAKDANDIYTLTVENTRKIQTVTVTKTLDDYRKDSEAVEFTFTATLMDGTGTDADPVAGYTIYTDAADAANNIVTGTDGKATFTLSVTNGTNGAAGKEFKIPCGMVLTVDETSNSDYDTAIVVTKISDASTTNKTGLSTESISVDGDRTIAFTNTLKEQPVSVWKTDMEHNTLTGAEFKLYRKDDFDDDTGEPEDGATAVATGSVDSNGILSLGSLKIGYYRLIETKAPDGYNAAESAIQITVRHDAVTAIQASSAAEVVREGDENGYWVTGQTEGTWQIRIWNNPGVVLPSTGGIGTHIFYILGTLLAALAGAGLLLRSHRG